MTSEPQILASRFGDAALAGPAQPPIDLVHHGVAGLCRRPEIPDYAKIPASRDCLSCLRRDRLVALLATTGTDEEAIMRNKANFRRARREAVGLLSRPAPPGLWPSAGRLYKQSQLVGGWDGPACETKPILEWPR